MRIFMFENVKKLFDLFYVCEACRKFMSILLLPWEIQLFLPCTLQVFRQRGSWHEDSVGEPLWMVWCYICPKCSTWKILEDRVKPSETYSHVARYSWHVDCDVNLDWRPWRDLQTCGFCPEMSHPKIQWLRKPSCKLFNDNFGAILAAISGTGLLQAGTRRCHLGSWPSGSCDREEDDGRWLQKCDSKSWENDDKRWNGWPILGINPCLDKPHINECISCHWSVPPMITTQDLKMMLKMKAKRNPCHYQSSSQRLFAITFLILMSIIITVIINPTIGKLWYEWSLIEICPK